MSGTITMTGEEYDALRAELDNWKRIAENRNEIIVTEVDPESRAVEEYRVDADSVRSSWALIRRYREQLDALREENERLRDDRDSFQRAGIRTMEELAALSAPAAGQDVGALVERAEKFAVIEKVMDMLECDEREGGVWTACTLLLISSAHKMNSAESIVTQESVTVDGENIGDWRVTVQRIDAALAAHKAGGDE